MTLLRRLAQGFGDLFWSFVCLCYVLYWGLSATVRFSLTLSLGGVLFVAAFLFALESVVTFAGHQLELIPLPVWVKVIILLCGVGMIFHRFSEWRELWKESKFADVVSFIIQQTSSFEWTGNASERLNQAKVFIPTILIAFIPVLRKKAGIRMNVLLKRENGELQRFACYPPDAVFDDTITFKDGQGAAGKAFVTQRPIYVPAIKYKHGIRIEKKDHDLELNVFVTTRSEEFKSVLCLPVLGNAQPWGILSIDSPQQDPFNLFDVRVARVAAALVGALLDRTVEGS